MAVSDDKPIQRPRLIRWPEESAPYVGPPLVLKQPIRGAKRIKLPSAPQPTPGATEQEGE